MKKPEDCHELNFLENNDELLRIPNNFIQSIKSNPRNPAYRLMAPSLDAMNGSQVTGAVLQTIEFRINYLKFSSQILVVSA